MFTSITYSSGVKHCSSLLLSAVSGGGWAFIFSIKPLCDAFGPNVHCSSSLEARDFDSFLWVFVSVCSAFFNWCHCITPPGVHWPVGLKMSREVIPVVLKDAPRQNLLNSESSELPFSFLEKNRHFSTQSCVLHAYCILLCLGGDAARSEQLHHPQHFVPAFLCLCISWLGFLSSWPLLGGSLTAVIFIRGRYCLQQLVLPVSCCYLWWHQSWDLFCLFSLHCFSRFLLRFLLIQTVKFLPILSSSSWLPVINAVLGVQVPFMPQICKISKLRKSLGRTLTAPVSIKD